MMLRLPFIIISMLIFYSCTGGNYEKKVAELDEIYGCDNPVRNLSKRKYKECIAAERGNNESFFDINKSFQDAFNLGGNQNVIFQNPVNPFLWNAALETTSSYSLKIADNQGGFIETDWIYESGSPQDRCLIKIRVVSAELVSNGVVTKFICENKINDQWITDKKVYTEEEKSITLKILNTAAEISKSTL